MKNSRNEHGFMTLTVLILGSAAFLALGVAMQANHRVHAQNRKLAREVQARAAALALAARRRPAVSG